ncbi:MAG: hypothetical protein JSV62_10025 [Promethearchaeota archaeon]|nr:MAG: hypothetical protein JSV62_10025 [Candidatus Lokiarchaeota archaeon]
MIDILIILLIIFLTIPFCILSLIAIWVYKDAKKRDMNGFAWIMVIWLIPLFIGLIIYLKFREHYSTITI